MQLAAAPGDAAVMPSPARHTVGGVEEFDAWTQEHKRRTERWTHCRQSRPRTVSWRTSI